MHDQWEKYYARPVFLQDFEMLVMRSGLRLSGGKMKSLYIPYRNKWEGWHERGAWNTLMKKLGKRMLVSSWNMRTHIQNYHESVAQWHTAARALGSASAYTPHAKLLTLYLAYHASHRAYETYIWYPWSITMWLEDWFVKELQKEFSDWQKIYEVIARPPKPYQTQRMIQKVWKWRVRKGTPGALDRIVAKYRNLGIYSVNHKPWSKAQIMRQVGNLIGCKEKLYSAQNEQRKNNAAFRKVHLLLKKRNDRLAKVADTIHQYVWLRTERIDAFKKATALVQPFYRRIEKEMGWRFGWAAHLSHQEMVDLLRGKRSISHAELLARHKNFYVAYVTTRRTRVIADPEERQKFLHTIIGVQTLEHKAEIRGSVACPGSARGRARVILHAKDVYHFKKGDILIANMTHPDYMPAIRNAAAIVTDEGGIVCHAAVISREFKIPCIIGTKIATKVFKDGDRVEVDANRGVVRKL